MAFLSAADEILDMLLGSQDVVSHSVSQADSALIAQLRPALTQNPGLNLMNGSITGINHNIWPDLVLFLTAFFTLNQSRLVFNGMEMSNESVCVR